MAESRGIRCYILSVNFRSISVIRVPSIERGIGGMAESRGIRCYILSVNFRSISVIRVPSTERAE
jgi:hypothetical protein